MASRTSMTSESVNKSDSLSGQRHSLVRGAIWTSLAVGLGLCLMPLIMGVREQKRLLRRPKGHVVKAPFAIDVDQTPAYD